MITDDPGTPGDGHWEVNLASAANRSAGATTYQLPVVDANYGVGERLQLKFELPWLVQDETGGESRSGVGDGLLGVKWRFYDAGEHGWQISTYPQIGFGFPQSAATRNGLVDSGASYLLPLEFMREVAGGDVNFEWGRWLRPATQVDTWIAGMTYTHVVTANFEWLAEIHDEAAVHSHRDELIVNLGTRWKMSSRYSLLFSAGRDVHNSLSQSNTLTTYLGLQTRY